MRDRGLLAVKPIGGGVYAEVTETGRLCRRHGHHPDDPAYVDSGAKGSVAGPSDVAAGEGRHRTTGRTRNPAPYSESPVARARRAKAIELVERLVAEGCVHFSEPDDDELAECCRVVDHAKRHGLEPQGRRIEKTRFGACALETFLVEGPHPNLRSQKPEEEMAVPVPTRLRSPHPAVAGLGDDDKRLVLPPVLRRRSLLSLQTPAAEAARRGYEVREPATRYSRREGEGEVDVVVDGFACTVTFKLRCGSVVPLPILSAVGSEPVNRPVRCEPVRAPHPSRACPCEGQG